MAGETVTRGPDLLVKDPGPLNLGITLECGQCFRWRQREDGFFEGAAGNRYLCLGVTEEGLLFRDTSREEYESFWKSYFALDTDYSRVERDFDSDPILRRAYQWAPGIRVLHQEGWEALASFILSQNNNIKRIRGIIQRLCDSFGEPIREGWHGFPSPRRLAECSLEDLEPLRAGFRSKYLLDAAQRVADGRLDLSAIAGLPLEEAQKQLMTVKGVGVKVAHCALLYGFGRLEGFPEDVWMKRVLTQLYPDGLSPAVLAHPGLAQQYLFHYARTCPDALPGKAG